MEEARKYPISESKFKDLIEPVIKRELKKPGRHSSILVHFTNILNGGRSINSSFPTFIPRLTNTKFINLCFPSTVEPLNASAAPEASSTKSIRHSTNLSSALS